MSKVTSKNFFLVIAPDVPNAQRAKHVAVHMEVSIPLIESGYIGKNFSTRALTCSKTLTVPKVAGGGTLSQGTLATSSDAMEKMTGSAFVVRADSEEQVWENLRKDPFYSSDEVVRRLHRMRTEIVGSDTLSYSGILRKSK